jgi:hypothetical protein
LSLSTSVITLIRLVSMVILVKLVTLVSVVSIYKEQAHSILLHAVEACGIDLQIN